MSSAAAAQVGSATPYAWPYDGPLRADDVAVVLIDMQVDFCGPSGYVAGPRTPPLSVLN